jgi:hypothetical protein
LQLYLAAARAVTSTVLLDLGITSIVNATLELPTVAYQKQGINMLHIRNRYGLYITNLVYLLPLLLILMYICSGSCVIQNIA